MRALREPADLQQIRGHGGIYDYFRDDSYGSQKRDCPTRYIRPKQLNARSSATTASMCG